MLRRAAFLVAALAGLAGCTSQAWYEGLREGARQQCRQTPDARGAQDCVERVNTQTYEGYQAERERRAAPVLTK